MRGKEKKFIWHQGLPNSISIQWALLGDQVLCQIPITLRESVTGSDLRELDLGGAGLSNDKPLRHQGLRQASPECCWTRTLGPALGFKEGFLEMVSEQSFCSKRALQLEGRERGEDYRLSPVAGAGPSLGGRQA